MNRLLEVVMTLIGGQEVWRVSGGGTKLLQLQMMSKYFRFSASVPVAATALLRCQTDFGTGRGA